MDLQLNNKLIIVTGSTGDGIGKHIAQELWHYGAYVVIHGRSQESVDQTIQGLLQVKDEEQEQEQESDAHNNQKHGDASKLIGIPGDVSTELGTHAFLEKLQATEEALHTKVYGLVNNVGIFEAKDFVDIDDAKWMEYYQTNTLSGVRLSKYFLPQFIDRNQGRIVFISSECGLRPLPHMLPYSVSKASQIALARGLAEMTKGTAVTVNSVLPGPTMTGGVRQYMTEFAELKGMDSLEEAVATYFQDAEPTSLLQRFFESQGSGGYYRLFVVALGEWH